MTQNMLNLLEVRSAFVSGSYGNIPSTLLRYSVDVLGYKIHAQIVTLESISDDELEGVYDILGIMIGDLRDSEGATFDVIKVGSPEELRKIDRLFLELYVVYGFGDC